MKDTRKPQKIGVIAIHPTVKQDPKTTFSLFYRGLGNNSGNLMFTTAMYRQLAGDVKHIGFTFDPAKISETYDAIVVPCANWLNATLDWTAFCDLLEKVDIPVIPIGLGLQSSHSDLSRVTISASCERLARLFSRKSKFISVRGDFTRDYLNSIGIANVVTTGCPSIYMRVVDNPKYDPDGGIAILSSRHPLTQKFLDTDSLHRSLFKFAAQQDTDIVFQSEFEEMEFIFGENEAALFPTRLPTGLQELYGFETPEELVKYLSTRGHSFCDLDTWAAYAQTKSGTVGTRLHGTILALNAGCPAVLMAHDSRTSEMIKFADIPTAHAPADLLAMDCSSLEAMLKSENYARYVEKRESNSLIYKNFLKDSDLQYQAGAMF